MISQSWPTRNWEILLIGGASGSGKTSISYRLAQHFGVGITEADDIHQAIMRMTTPEQQPILHLWQTNPEIRQWPPERILEHFIALCEQLNPAYEAVIANHLETDIPLVLEGDYLLPSLAAQGGFGGYPNNGRVRALFLYEDDETQFIRNYLLREPDRGEQRRRAAISLLHNAWLAQEVAQWGGMLLPARPWESTLERAIALLNE
jgi:2-phosphoglycerate kinase